MTVDHAGSRPLGIDETMGNTTTFGFLSLRPLTGRSQGTGVGERQWDLEALRTFAGTAIGTCF